MIRSALLGAALLVASCDTGSLIESECTEILDGFCWTYLGPDKWITSIAETPWGLFAGTRDGYWGPPATFRLNPATGRWEPRGLTYGINAAMLMVPGATPRLLVGLSRMPDELLDASIYATDDGGLSWQEWDDGLARRVGGEAQVHSLAMDPGNPQRLFAGHAPAIRRSDDGGKTWRYVLGSEDSWGGWSFFILVSPARDGRIWHLRTTAWDTGMLDRSDDWGETWEHIHLGPFHVPTRLVADPANPDRLWSGGGGSVRISDDGGSTWRISLLLGEAFAQGLILADGYVYAAAGRYHRLTDPDEIPTLELYRSPMDREEWEALSVPQNAKGATWMTIGSDGSFILATANGIWTIRHHH